MNEEMWHGTVGGYVNHHCRCDGCRHAKAIYMSVYRSTPQYRQWRRNQLKRWRAARKAAP